MTTAKTILLALFIAASFAGTAQSADSLFPAIQTVERPKKPTSSVELNTFVNQSFDLSEKTSRIRTDLNSVFEALKNPTLDDLKQIAAKFTNSTSILKSLLPDVQNLITTAPDLISKVKPRIGIFEIVRALSNFKSATQALHNAIGNATFMLTTTVPRLLEMMPKGSSFAGDSTAQQQ